MRTPNLLTAFVDNGVLVGMDIVGKGARRGGPEVGEELVFGIEGDDGEMEFLEDRSGQGGRGDDGNGGFDNGRGEVLYRDVREWNTVNDFFELKMDVRVLSFVGGGILKLWA